MRNEKQKTIFAIAVSISLHSLFFVAAGRMVLPGAGILQEEAGKIFRLREVDRTPAEVDLFDVPEPAVSFPEPEKSIPDAEMALIEDAATIHLEQQDIPAKIEREKLAMEKFLDLPDLAGDVPVREELSRAEGERIREGFLPDVRYLTEVILSEGPSSTSKAPAIEITAIPGPREHTPLLDVPVTGGLTVNGQRKVTPDEKERALPIASKRNMDYEDVSSFLELDLKTFEDRSTGNRFFRIEVRVKDGIKIEVMPKEIVFLIDSSRSLTPERFQHVQQGMIRALRGLGPGDSFNIVAFKQEMEQFRDLPVRATPENIRAGIAFVNGLSADGMTDIENALLGIVSGSPGIVPSYVVLISDGRPTAGIVSPREIIRTITRENSGRRSVFSLGVGLRVDQDLLDFISYQNRGWSSSALARDSAGRDLFSLYEEISSPVLTNIRYRVSGIKQSEIFPGELPDFFHDRPLVVYGKYRDEDIFSMQILGEIGGKTKELMFQRSLKEAEKGGPEIEKGWAFNRIYDKIARDTMGKGKGRPDREEIERMSRKYDIPIPYFLDENMRLFPGEE